MRILSFIKYHAALPRSIRGKLLIAFLSLGAMTGLLGTYGIYQIRDVGLITANTYDQPLMAINYARSAQVNFEQLVDNTLDTEHPLLASKVGDELALSMLGDLSVVEKRASSPAALQLARHVQELSLHWLEVRKQRNQLDKLGSDHRLFRSPISKELRESFEKLSERMAADGFVERRLAMSASAGALHSSVFATSGAVLFALLMTLMMSRIIVAPLTAAAAVASRIATGDIETAIRSSGQRRSKRAALIDVLYARQAVRTPHRTAEPDRRRHDREGSASHCQ